MVIVVPGRTVGLLTEAGSSWAGPGEQGGRQVPTPGPDAVAPGGTRVTPDPDPSP